MNETLRPPRPLDDVHRRLEAVLDNATASIFLMDERQQCIYMNHAAERLTGYTLREILALDMPLHDIIHHTHPDGSPFPLHECAIDRAYPERHRVQGEEVFVHKDGSFYPVAFTASPIRDEASETVGTIIEVRDIRAERLAAERQQLLLNELNHRVKNTLASVQAIALHSFRGVSLENLDNFNGRLLALSRAHDVLRDASWQSPSIREVVDGAVETFGSDRFEIGGPDCPIDPKAAVSLSMVLHELGTNAAKYGALSSAAGTVHLGWTLEHHDDAVSIDLLWEERNGPPTGTPGRPGFGMKLIRQVAAEFGGSAVLDFRTEGLRCEIRARMPKSAAFEIL
ncbi:PAS domain S-box protein [Altererythrobacter soli]|uniref:histidine kinase n=1 Tax=Croceibacterium soli TaxID=1739690 RepID=A0A6I4UY32_9SPHN|nr:HWE histidine kinase domain-containing protein [Croceibacterium soli]MXP41885.1 PAS domain S-box protein [Croceibacterium soli]